MKKIKKENIVNAIKFFILAAMMLQGTFLTFVLIGVGIGLPLTTWTLLLLCALAGISVFGYFKWLER